MHPTPRWWSYFAAQRHQNCIKVRILSKYECKLALTDNKLFFNLQFIAEGQCTSKEKAKEINKNWSIKLWWKRQRMKNQEWRTFKYDLCVIVFFIWFSIVSWITMSHAYNIYTSTQTYRPLRILNFFALSVLCDLSNVSCSVTLKITLVCYWNWQAERMPFLYHHFTNVLFYTLNISLSSFLFRVSLNS